MLFVTLQATQTDRSVTTLGVMLIQQTKDHGHTRDYTVTVDLGGGDRFDFPIEGFEWKRRAWELVHDAIEELRKEVTQIENVGGNTPADDG